MKIFQIITVSEYGGAQSFVANLVNNLADNNDVFLLYGGEGEAWEHLDVNFTRIRLNKHRKQISLADLFLFFKLLYYRFRYNPDIIHLHSSKMGILGRLAFSKKKTIVTLHGFDSVRMQYRKFLVLEKLLKNRAAKIVAVSQYDVLIMKEEGIETNVDYIYNGVPDYTKKQYRIPSEMKHKIEAIKSNYSKVVMSIARISKQKRFDLFLDIAQNLPDYAFIWIGNKETLTNLPSNVFCLGELQNAHSYLPYADVFLLPSNYEGLPISMLEALSFSKPIVASAVGGIPEMLNNGAGFAVPNELDKFVEKLKYILSNEEEYQKMALRAREIYLDKFTLEQMTAKYLSLYANIKNKNNK